MTKQLFSWDEITNEIQIEEDQEDLRKRSDECGFAYVALLPSGVVVLKTDRHIALECWAEDVNEADVLFSNVADYIELQTEE